MDTDPYGTETLYHFERRSHRVIVTDDDFLTATINAELYPAITAYPWQDWFAHLFYSSGRSEAWILSHDSQVAITLRAGIVNMPYLRAKICKVPDLYKLAGRALVRACWDSIKPTANKQPAEPRPHSNGRANGAGAKRYRGEAVALQDYISEAAGERH